MQPYRLVVFLLAGIFHRADEYYKALIQQIERVGGNCIKIDPYCRTAKFHQKPHPDIDKLHFDLEVQLAIGMIEAVIEKMKIDNVIDKNTILAIAGHSKGALAAVKILSLVKEFHKSLLWAPAMPADINILSYSSVVSFTSLLSSPRFWLNYPVKRSFENTVRGIYNHRMTPEEMRESYNNGLFYESSIIIKQLAGFPINLSLGNKKLMDATRVDYEKLRNVETEGCVIIANEDNIVPKKGAIKFADQLGFSHETFAETSHDVFWGKPGQRIIEKSLDFLLN